MLIGRTALTASPATTTALFMTTVIPERLTRGCDAYGAAIINKYPVFNVL